MDARSPHAVAGATLALDAVAAEIVASLGEAGIRSLVLKGPAVAPWLYDKRGDRAYDDIDLLVAPDELGAAERVLRASGFRFVHDDPHGRVWVRGPVNLDLHGRLAGVGVGAAPAFERLLADSEELTLARGPVRVPSVPARALHVALHATQHGSADGKAMEDLRRAVERVRFADWQRAAALADDLGARPVLDAGLALSPEGRELLRLLGGDPERAAAATHTGSDIPDGVIGIVRLAGTPGLRGKASLVLREFFPTATYLRAHLTLARRGRAGLLLARAWRPFLVLLRTGPALVAIVRTRRQRRPF